MLSNMDNIFDSLNSSSFNTPKKYKKPLSNDSPHHQFFTEMLQIIDTVKVIDKQGNDVTSKLKCLKALKMTINGVTEMWKHLHEEESLKFLLTRRLNQDALENFFGLVRQQGGNCDNPTPNQFTRAFVSCLWTISCRQFHQAIVQKIRTFS